jgi:hypothetical protein
LRRSQRGGGGTRYSFLIGIGGVSSFDPAITKEAPAMLSFLTGFTLLALSFVAAPWHRYWHWLERTAGVR